MLTPCNGEAVAYAEFVERHPELTFVGWEWPQIDDPDRELAGTLGLTGHPAVAAIDAQGRVVARHIGGGDRETWEALAAELE